MVAEKASKMVLKATLRRVARPSKVIGEVVMPEVVLLVLFEEPEKDVKPLEDEPLPDEEPLAEEELLPEELLPEEPLPEDEPLPEEELLPAEA